MSTQNTKTLLALITLIAAIAFSGCASKAPYLRYSFDETARLKVESMAILGKARQSYPLGESGADSVMNGIHSAYQDASLRSMNGESMRQWEILLDSNQGSMAGIMRQWKQHDTLSIAMIQQAQIVVAGDFDRISILEGNKGR
jgi:hypothetical protein